MCGIIGFVGREQAAPILLDGLARMEYRGYDSAGIAVRSETAGLQVRKAKGRLQVLDELTHGGADLEGVLGIAPLDDSLQNGAVFRGTLQVCKGICGQRAQSLWRI